jgi:hypothetical protein
MNTEPGAVFDAHVRAEFVECSVDATMAAMTERPAAKGLICDSLRTLIHCGRTRALAQPAMDHDAARENV